MEKLNVLNVAFRTTDGIAHHIKQEFKEVCFEDSYFLANQIVYEVMKEKVYMYQAMLVAFWSDE